MSWTQRDIPDLTGRTAVVIGANGGLGLETSIALAGAGAHVIMAARNQVKAEHARQQILATYPQASLKVVPLDLGDLASVKSAADQILANHDSIDVLVNNAGVMGMPESRTVDGFEQQLGVDHLGHFAFTAHLLAAVLKADRPRVVTVTSTARFMGRAFDPKNPHLVGNYGPWKSYAQAKQANYHFGLGLQQRFKSAGVNAQSLIAHPGISATELQVTTVKEGGGGVTAKFFQKLAAAGMEPSVGVRPQLRAATDPNARGGQLYAPRWGGQGAAVSRPILRRWDLTKRIAQLWEMSEHETGIRLDVASASQR